MRESSLKNFSTADRFSGSKSDAKSLPQSILDVSPFVSGFCPDSTIPRARKGNN